MPSPAPLLTATGRRPTHPLGLTFCLALAAALSLRGVDETAKNAPAGAPPHRNSLDVQFRDVPGTPVQFAAYETRVSDWQAFLADTKYNWSFKPHFRQTGDHPAVNISVGDAMRFCEWLTNKERASGQLTPMQSYRLPTSREWDAAVGLNTSRSTERATSQKVIDEQAFPWGLEWPPPPKAGNFNSTEINGSDDGFAFTAPVGNFAPSKDGLHDLAGNVWEWVQDPETQSDSGGKLRGGAWVYFRKECLLSAYLYEVPADLRAPSVGFRMVLEDKQRTAAFLAHQEQTEKEQAQKSRDQVMSRPSVDAAEVARLREQITAKPTVSSNAPALPDPKSLKPAAPGASFTNSLNMLFQPAAGGRLLVSAHEATVQDYQIFLDATKEEWSRAPSFAFKPNHPIMNITWHEAKGFCAWLTERDRGLGLIPPKAVYRLPSDLEWSAAAELKNESGADPAARHLGNKTDFPWGQQAAPPPSSANLDTNNMTGYQDKYSHTAPVGSFSPNASGLFDLAGNVSEWCEDPWPGTANERVVRGSSFLSSNPESLLSSARQHTAESTARADVGFRCVLDLEPH